MQLSQYVVAKRQQATCRIPPVNKPCTSSQVVIGLEKSVERSTGKMCSGVLQHCVVVVFSTPSSDTETYEKLTRSSAIAEGPRDASCQLKSCQLSRNSAKTTYTTSPDRIDGMKLEIQSEAMRDKQCAVCCYRPHTTALSLVVSSLKSVCCDVSMGLCSVVMPRSPALCLT